VITATDPLTGDRGKEPLRLLATYRRNAADPTNVDFGQNLIHESKAGTLRWVMPWKYFNRARAAASAMAWRKGCSARG